MEHVTTSRFILMDSYTEVEAVRDAMLKIQERSIEFVKDKLLADIRKLSSYQLNSPDLRAEAEHHSQMVSELVGNAYVEALKGMSVIPSHSEGHDEGHIKFNAGPAYKQLVRVSQFGWGSL